MSLSTCRLQWRDKWWVINDPISLWMFCLWAERTQLDFTWTGTQGASHLSRWRKVEWFGLRDIGSQGLGHCRTRLHFLALPSWPLLINVRHWLKLVSFLPKVCLQVLLGLALLNVIVRVGMSLSFPLSFLGLQNLSKGTYWSSLGHKSILVPADCGLWICKKMTLSRGQLDWTGWDSRIPQEGTVMGRQYISTQMTIPLILYHIQGAFIAVTLLELTSPALQDRDDYPRLTDEETNVKEVKLGQRSRGWVAESEFTCRFAGFKFQITKDTESPSEFLETQSLVLCIILACFLVCRCLQHWEL